MPTAVKTRRRKPAETGLEPVALAVVSRALFSPMPTDIDSGALEAVYAGRVVRTHAEVGKAFGVAKATVSTNWSPDGLPGGEGAYSLLEIAKWRVGRNRRNTASRSDASEASRALKSRVEEADARSAELRAERLERLEQEAAGRLIDRDAVGTAIKVAAVTLTERLMRLPSQHAPSLPANIADDITRMYERGIHRELVAFSETTGRTLLENYGAKNGHAE